MVENSGIEWTHHTFNPWVGCTAASPACDHCYAKALVEGRMGRDFAERRRTAPANWRLPLRWNRRAAETGRRERVFCASLADVFDNQVPPEWRVDLFALIHETPSLAWLLLTKRPMNIGRMLPPDWGEGYPNVWLGTTVENQEEADRRIPHLLAVPARNRFLSCEPLLRLVQVQHWLRGKCTKPRCDCPDGAGCVYAYAAHEPAVDWVICGGESGPGARPMHPEWARNLRDQCASASVPFFFKQWGEWAPVVEDGHEKSEGGGREGALWEDDQWRFFPTGERHGTTFRVGKRRAGAILDGREHREFPA